MFYKESIVEYDMSAAGVSCLHAEGYMDKKTYKNLMSYDKITRNIKQGLFIRDGNLQKEKTTALKKYVDIFIKENNILEENVLEIASDAIWLKKQKANKFIFANGIVKFRKDREATSLFMVKKDRFYFDSFSGDFFIRGFNDSNEFTKRMGSLIYRLEMNMFNPKSLYLFLHKLRNDAYDGVLEYKSEKHIKYIVNYLIDYLII